MSLLSIAMFCCAACDRNHARASCPWYPEARDAHKDTLLDDLEEKRKDLGVFLRRGDVVKHALGDPCLFHAIASSLLKLGVVTSLSGPQLRRMATGWMPAHGDTVLLCSSLEDWVAKDSPGSSVAAHAASIRMGAWGGSIEIARSDTAGGDYSFKLVTRVPARSDGSAVRDSVGHRPIVYLVYDGSHYNELIPHGEPIELDAHFEPVEVRAPPLLVPHKEKPVSPASAPPKAAPTAPRKTPPPRKKPPSPRKTPPPWKTAAALKEAPAVPTSKPPASTPAPTSHSLQPKQTPAPLETPTPPAPPAPRKKAPAELAVPTSKPPASTPALTSHLLQPKQTPAPLETPAPPAPLAPRKKAAADTGRAAGADVEAAGFDACAAIAEATEAA
ncbi:hypothetical protein M885DRAFT_622575, partial [Pelagophyceae sp. CCMP2097]